MTVEEFNVEFDLLYNNIMSNQAPGLDEYEKSMFLTQAQESFIIDIYNGASTGEGFDSTEQSTSFINDLILQHNTTNFEAGSGITPTSRFVTLPENVWYIIYESSILNDSNLECGNAINAIVVPTTHDEVFKIMKNPYRGASKDRVLRLKNGNKIELISKYNIESYLVRFISKPSPIILADLTEWDADIDGEVRPMTCLLNPITHRLILNKAVQFAKLSMSNK